MPSRAVRLLFMLCLLGGPGVSPATARPQAEAAPAMGQPRVALPTLAGETALMTGEGWQLQGLRWTAAREAQATFALSVAVAQATIDDLPVSLSEISLSCAEAILGTAPECARGELSFKLDDQQLGGDWALAWAGEEPAADINLKIPGGVLELTLRGGLLSARTTELELSSWLPSRPGLLPDWLHRPAGLLTAQARMSLADTQTVTLDWSLADGAFDSMDGTRAGAALTMAGTVSASGLGATPVLAIDHRITGGELLLDPAYFSFSAAPEVVLAATATWQAGWAGPIALTATVGDGDGLALEAAGELSQSFAVNQLEIDLQDLLLAQAWGRYIAPLLERTPLAGLAPTGRVRAGLRFVAGELEHLSAGLEAVAFGEAGATFRSRGLNGTLDYSRQGDSLDSNLSWDSLGYYTLGIGPADAYFFAGGGQFQLLRPLFLPVLDGGLEVDELMVTRLAGEDVTLDFQGELKPISLKLITQALDWPVLEGTLGGTIPRVSLRDQVLEVGGTVEIAVFDGQVTVDSLRLERLFGVLPTLAADIAIADIDLNQMTSAFSFGRIEGRLKGQVDGLRMLDWRPVAFDLELRTDESARTRRRISQRAVDNLSSIGGAGAALGSTFLRLFDDFGYRRLGLSCELRNNSCAMGGVGDAGRGYYLVEGSGIPRIDIIGFSRQVDWPQLLRRLEAATRSGAATVE
ncbi:MAG: hypothetical protein AAGA23_07655 [Pseudomonadota bacterium]